MDQNEKYTKMEKDKAHENVIKIYNRAFIVIILTSAALLFEAIDFIKIEKFINVFHIKWSLFVCALSLSLSLLFGVAGYIGHLSYRVGYYEGKYSRFNENENDEMEEINIISKIGRFVDQQIEKMTIRKMSIVTITKLLLQSSFCYLVIGGITFLAVLLQLFFV